MALVQAEQVREHAILQCNAAMQRETQHLASVKRLQAEFNKVSYCYFLFLTKQGISKSSHHAETNFRSTGQGTRFS